MMMTPLLVFLMTFSQLAAGDATPLTQEKLAQGLQKYQDLTSLEAPFTQVKTIKDIAVVVKSEGKFIINRCQGPDQGVTCQGVTCQGVTWMITKPSPMGAIL